MGQQPMFFIDIIRNWEFGIGFSVSLKRVWLKLLFIEMAFDADGKGIEFFVSPQ